MKRIARILTGGAVLAASPISVGFGQAEPRAPRTVTIEMHDFVFKPAAVTVWYGDTVRFVQRSNSPHNVEFKQVPAGTQFDDGVAALPTQVGSQPPRVPTVPRFGPFLLVNGDVYTIVIGDAFAPGDHRYICTPHDALGMKGVILVNREEG